MKWNDIKNLIKEELKAGGPCICRKYQTGPDGYSKCIEWSPPGCGDASFKVTDTDMDEEKTEMKKLKEAEVTADNNKFNLRTGVNKNPTKLGIKIQFEPKGEFLSPDVKNKLEVALQEKLNAALLQYNIQVSKDTDVPREHVIGFFIPISQLKNLIVKALGGSDIGAEIEEPKVAAPTPEPSKPTSPPSPQPALSEEEEKISEMITQELLNEALRVRDLNEISKVVYKEDFYGFINAGQNVLRTLEEHGFDSRLSKKYLEHLVKNNII